MSGLRKVVVPAIVVSALGLWTFGVAWAGDDPPAQESKPAEKGKPEKADGDKGAEGRRARHRGQATTSLELHTAGPFQAPYAFKEEKNGKAARKESGHTRRALCLRP